MNDCIYFLNLFGEYDHFEYRDASEEKERKKYKKMTPEEATLEEMSY